MDKIRLVLREPENVIDEVPGMGSNPDMQKMLRQLILIYNTMPVVLKIEPQEGIR